MKVLVDFPYSYSVVIDADQLQPLMKILENSVSWEKDYSNGKSRIKIIPNKDLPNVEFIREEDYNVAKFVSQSADE